MDPLQKDKFQRLKFCVINFSTFSHQFKKQKNGHWSEIN